MQQGMATQGKFLGCDLSETREVWPAAVYLLVWCAASLTCLITQAVLSHAVVTEEAV